MVQKVKDRLIGGAVVTVSNILVGLVLFFFGGVRTNANSFKELVNNKLDKTEYETDQKQRWDSHYKVHDLLFEKIGNTDAKVDWLYKNEIQKNNNAIPPLRNN